MSDKNNSSFYSLPESFSRIDNAIASNGWALCSCSNLLSSWSPEHGWEDITSQIKVDGFHFCKLGVLCVDEKIEQIALCSPGLRRLEWTVAVSSLLSIPVIGIHVTESYLIFVGAGPAGLTLHVYEITLQGPASKFFVESPPGMIIAAWQGCPEKRDNLIYVLSKDDISSIDPESCDQPVLRKVKDFDPACRMGFDSAELFCQTAKGIYLSSLAGDSLLLCLDKSRLEIFHTRVSSVEGGQKLLPAYEAQNHFPVCKMIELLLGTEDPIRIDWQWIDIVPDKECRPLAAITSSGIYKARKDSCITIKAVNDQLSLRINLLPWLFWMKWEDALGCAFDLVLESGISEPLLTATLAGYLGTDACRLLFSHVYGKPLPDSAFFGEDRIQDLFGYFGSEVAPLVEQQLKNEQNPFCLLVACCASGALGEEDNEPILWTRKHPKPKEAIVRLLGNQHSIVRKHAITAAGNLKLPETAPVICELIKNEISDDAKDIRQRAIKAFSRLPDIGEPEYEAVKNAVLFDMGRFVREDAIEALGDMYTWPETIDTLISAMADISYFPRRKARKTFEKHNRKLLNLDQLYRLSDLVILNELTAVADSKNYHSFQMGGILKTLVHSLASDFENLKLFCTRPSSYRKAAGCLILVYFYLQSFLGVENFFTDNSDEDAIQETVRFLDACFELPVATDREVAALLGGKGRQKAGFEIAWKVFSLDPDIGIKIGIIAWAGLSDKLLESSRPGKTGNPVSEGFQPLHVRLRQSKAARDPMEIIGKELRRRSQAGSLDGALCLLAMALRGDSESRNRLKQRILSGEYSTDAPLLTFSCYTILPQEEKLPYISILIRMQDIALHVRAAFMDTLCLHENNLKKQINEESLKTLYADIAASPFVDFWGRLTKAWELYDMGFPDYLRAFWAEAEQKGRVTGDNRVEFVIDMAVLGHGEHMDTVRKKWREWENYRALKAFACMGTPADIPSLESGIKVGWDSDFVQRAIDAIRRRWNT